MMEALEVSQATLTPHLKSLFKYKILKGKIEKAGLNESTVFHYNSKFSNNKTAFTLALPEIIETESGAKIAQDLLQRDR
jgi:hypothetical protein